MRGVSYSDESRADRSCDSTLGEIQQAHRRLNNGSRCGCAVVRAGEMVGLFRVAGTAGSCVGASLMSLRCVESSLVCFAEDIIVIELQQMGIEMRWSDRLAGSSCSIGTHEVSHRSILKTYGGFWQTLLFLKMLPPRRFATHQE